MTGVFDIADGFIDTVAKHSPLSATYMGVPGFDHLMADFSPQAAEAFDSETRSALRAMKAAEPANERERLCRDTFVEETKLSVEQFESRNRCIGNNIHGVSSAIA